MASITQEPINTLIKKRSLSETGHAINVANLQDLVAFVTGYGAIYSPSKNNLKLPQLNTLVTTANAA